MALRSVLSFVRAVGRWYANTRPEEVMGKSNAEDATEDEEQNESPGFVAAVVNILERYIFSIIRAR